MLEEDTVLPESTEGSQIIGPKHKEVVAGDEEEQRPSKKAKGKQQEKYHEGTAIKMVGANLYKR